MYDKNYAKTWIRHFESNDDVFRTKYLEPYLKEKLLEILDNPKILDIGCGWGLALDFLKPQSKYYGVDIVPEFFEYIKNKYKGKFDLLSLNKGKLPNDIDFHDNYFDTVICSMVLHTVSDMQESIKTLFSKTKNGARLLIITFNDKSQDYLKSCFERIDEQTENYVRGMFVLPSKTKIDTEIYFHREKNYENELEKYGTFSKKILGPIFVAYECTKVEII